MKNKLSWYYKKIRFLLKSKIDLDKKTTIYNSLDDLFNHFGSDKGTSVKKSPLKSGIEMALIGGLAAFAGFLIGNLFTL